MILHEVELLYKDRVRTKLFLQELKVFTVWRVLVNKLVFELKLVAEAQFWWKKGFLEKNGQLVPEFSITEALKAPFKFELADVPIELRCINPSVLEFELFFNPQTQSRKSHAHLMAPFDDSCLNEKPRASHLSNAATNSSRSKEPGSPIWLSGRSGASTPSLDKPMFPSPFPGASPPRRHSPAESAHSSPSTLTPLIPFASMASSALIQLNPEGSSNPQDVQVHSGYQASQTSHISESLLVPQTSHTLGSSSPSVPILLSSSTPPASCYHPAPSPPARVTVSNADFSNDQTCHQSGLRRGTGLSTENIFTEKPRSQDFGLGHSAVSALDFSIRVESHIPTTRLEFLTSEWDRRSQISKSLVSQEADRLSTNAQVHHSPSPFPRPGPSRFQEPPETSTLIAPPDSSKGEPRSLYRQDVYSKASENPPSIRLVKEISNLFW